MNQLVVKVVMAEGQRALIVEGTRLLFEDAEDGNVLPAIFKVLDDAGFVPNLTMGYHDQVQFEFSGCIPKWGMPTATGFANCRRASQRRAHGMESAWQALFCYFDLSLEPLAPVIDALDVTPATLELTRS